MKRHQLNIRISKDLKEQFVSLCKEVDRKPSVLMRSWIEKFIRENEKYNSK
ncbi:hypothetical protein ACFFF5_10435 [Lederbergia wuyishanensis]|uniref:DNA-binding protein n=1 Tax=Lederbergia wuyishanensis TaxID=1347903 RepID=A0ABU0D6V9_9BACI|nr:hypothetical protein [Lederbergia wuyishanensis]MCJ8008829.1 hypothetical protein [Lederbergia wuyishanensis]MDQ0344151.1 putative DNA-binding protein [Lederbergia wuyishanensis]